jgi:hypothetical protein
MMAEGMAKVTAEVMAKVTAKALAEETFVATAKATPKAMAKATDEASAEGMAKVVAEETAKATTKATAKEMTQVTHGIILNLIYVNCRESTMVSSKICLGETLALTQTQHIMHRHRVQLVGELLLELFVRGSNPSGVGLLLESVVRGWNPTCPIRVHSSIDTGNLTAKEVCISIVS